jgi:hypothetical protein
VDSPAIIVVDGVEAFCTAHGCDSNSNADWGVLVDEVLNPLCGTGAAVVLVDHIAKGKSVNGAFALEEGGGEGGCSRVTCVTPWYPPSSPPSGSTRL